MPSKSCIFAALVKINMIIHVIQHIPYEGAGCIENWAAQNHHSLQYIPVYESHCFPPASNVQSLIILGGTMGAYEDALYEWMPTEKKFIKEVIDSGKPVLGICLGSQLIAAVLGAKVFKHKHNEIGWHAVYLNEKGLQSACFTNCPPVMHAMHWHGDTFDLPVGAEWLAYSSATPNQAFSFGKNVLALQFHPEFDAQLIETLCAIAGDTLKNEGFTQSTQNILSRLDFTQKANQYMYSILSNFFHQR